MRRTQEEINAIANHLTQRHFGCTPDIVNQAFKNLGLSIMTNDEIIRRIETLSDNPVFLSKVSQSIKNVVNGSDLAKAIYGKISEMSKEYRTNPVIDKESTTMNEENEIKNKIDNMFERIKELANESGVEVIAAGSMGELMGKMIEHHEKLTGVKHTTPVKPEMMEPMANLIKNLYPNLMSGILGDINGKCDNPNCPIHGKAKTDCAVSNEDLEATAQSAFGIDYPRLAIILNALDLGKLVDYVVRTPESIKITISFLDRTKVLNAIKLTNAKDLTGSALRTLVENNKRANNGIFKFDKQSYAEFLITENFGIGLKEYNTILKELGIEDDTICFCKGFRHPHLKFDVNSVIFEAIGEKAVEIINGKYSIQIEGDEVELHKTIQWDKEKGDLVSKEMQDKPWLNDATIELFGMSSANINEIMSVLELGTLEENSDDNGLYLDKDDVILIRFAIHEYGLRNNFGNISKLSDDMESNNFVLPHRTEVAFLVGATLNIDLDIYELLVKHMGLVGYYRDDKGDLVISDVEYEALSEIIDKYTLNKRPETMADVISAIEQGKVKKESVSAADLASKHEELATTTQNLSPIGESINEMLIANGVVNGKLTGKELSDLVLDAILNKTKDTSEFVNQAFVSVLKDIITNK